MKDELFDTPEKVVAAVSNLTNLLTHPGWLLVKEIADANIEILTDNILKGGDKVEMDRFRDKLEALQNVINTPEDRLRDLRGDTAPEVELDPYPKLPPADPGTS